MSDPYLAEIRMVSFNFPPKGWALCNGQLLPINQNQALFALLGTTYGGNGITTFGLPNLQGRVPVHFGQGSGLSAIVLGQTGGEQAHTLTLNELPPHRHTPVGSSNTADQATPGAHLWADNAFATYSTTADGVMNPSAIASAGGGQAHDNMPPYLVVNFVICLSGIFPSS